MNGTYPALLSPMKIGPATLRNRALMSGHSMVLGNSDGVSDAHRTYLVTRAKGGAAVVGFESMPVQPYVDRSRKANCLPLFSDIILPSLTRTADEVHEAGGLLMANLRHGGYNTSFLNNKAAPSMSVVPNVMGEVPTQMSQSELAQLVRDFGAAAGRTRTAGVDMIEVNVGLDYLLGASLNPTLNTRTDAYGGNLQGRIRLLREVLHSVRDAVHGDVAVGIKISTAHVIRGDPDDFGTEQSLEVTGLLAEEGLLDFVSLVKGSYRSGDMLIPPMWVPRMQLREEGAIFKAALNIPVIVGHRIRTAAESELLLSEGSADAITAARTWIAEPDWIAKIEAGNEEQVRPCMSCNQACVGFYARGLPGTCVVNPVAGRETELGELTPAPAPAQKSVAVIGGGPGGMEAARAAAERGFLVTLYEASEHLGGWMRIAATNPHRGEMNLPIAWWEAELRRLGVTIRLGHSVSKDEPPQADHIIWAIGALPSQTMVRRLRPFLFNGIQGAEDLPYGRDVLTGKYQLSGKVLIIDEEGSWPAVTLLEITAAMPEVADVTVTTTERAELGETRTQWTQEGFHVAERLAKTGAQILTGKMVERIDGKSVTLVGGGQLGPFDHIVLSTGTASLPIPEGALAVGDCIAPRGIWAAVNDASRLVRQL